MSINTPQVRGRDLAPLGVWTCKIGMGPPHPAAGLDFPMRRAVEEVYRAITGHDSDFLFSGWRGRLNSGELRTLTEEQRGVYLAQREVIEAAFPHSARERDPVRRAAQEVLDVLEHDDNQIPAQREALAALREALDG